MKLLHGDCLAELAKLPDESVHLLLTDPPYGDDTAYGMSKRAIANNESPLVGLYALHLAYRVLKPDAVAYFFLDIKHYPFIAVFIETYTRYRVRSVIVWNKMRVGMGFGIRPQHELIFALEKGKPHYKDLGFPNVLSYPRTDCAHHIHQKPVELLERLIEQTTYPGHTVLDPFMGSGSTAVACQRLARHFIGIELDAAHFARARQRIGLPHAAAANSLPQEPATALTT